MTYYTPPVHTVDEHRILPIGGFTRPSDWGVVIIVGGEERQYRNVQAMWNRDQKQWLIPTATYGTRTKKKTWSIRDNWHQGDPLWNNGPLPPEVLKAGFQAILNQIKTELDLLEEMRASIEGDGPPRVPGTELKDN